MKRTMYISENKVTIKKAFQNSKEGKWEFKKKRKNRFFQCLFFPFALPLGVKRRLSIFNSKFRG